MFFVVSFSFYPHTGGIINDTLCPLSKFFLQSNSEVIYFPVVTILIHCNRAITHSLLLFVFKISQNVNCFILKHRYIKFSISCSTCSNCSFVKPLIPSTLRNLLGDIPFICRKALENTSGSLYPQDIATVSIE